MNQPLHPLTIEGVHQTDEENAALLVFRDDQERLFAIPIGLCEALAIQMALDNKQPGRPFTHDLMRALMERLDASVSRVIIDDFSGGTYFARIMLNTEAGPITLDCRPSDGIALAIRAHAPFFATDAVIAQSNT